MIKGINRTIIEVTETENVYYERALLVLRPEYADIQRDLLEREAKKMLASMNAPSSVKRCHAVLYWAIRLGGSAIFGAIVTLLIMYLM